MNPILESLETRRLMATFHVTNTNDTGAGSLRAAITSANATPAADVINFNISSASRVISPMTALPTITAPVTIDATTQPGYAGKPLVTLNGASVSAGGCGFTIQGNDVLIRGMAIGNFLAGNGAGVLVGISALRATVRDCYLGVAADGTTAMPNFDGFRAFGPAAQVLYSTVSGNQRYGVWLSEDGGKVLNSTVGLAPATSAALGNGSVGVYVDGGDFCIVEDSVVGGNTAHGIFVDLPATNPIIRDNIIGMTPGRTALRGNGTAGILFRNLLAGQITSNRIATSDLYGIFLDSSDHVTIEANNIGFGANTAVDFGGTAGILLSGSNNCTVRTNQIGFNDVGIRVYGSPLNTIRGNSIGTLLDNSTAIPNRVGIELEYAEGNFIGTDVVAGTDANVISYNTNQGIHVIRGNRNTILGNRFKNNGGLDIDLGTAGVTHNDAGDTDTGANTLLNTITPVFGAYNPVGSSTTTVSFRATNETASAAAYRVDFYASNLLKTQFNIGEGSRHLASRTISFSGQGELNFNTTIPLEIDGTQIAATVTRLVNGLPTDTSEMSTAMRVQGAPFITGSAFEFETGNAVSFQFSRIVDASISTGDVSIANIATGQTYSALSVTPGATNNSHVWKFSNTLPDGNYRATLNRAGVSASVPLGPGSAILNAEGPNTLDFHVLRGDDNRDKKVDFSDLLIVAANYNTTNKTFSKGDFNYDNKVDFNDLLILASRYNKQLGAAPAPVGALSHPLRKRGPGSDILG